MCLGKEAAGDRVAMGTGGVADFLRKSQGASQMVIQEAA